MTFIQAFSFPIVLVGLALVLRAIDVKRLLANNKAQHSMFACLLGLSVLWSFHTQLHPGLDINFLGLAAVTLMLGFRLAIVVSTIAFVATHFFMGYSTELIAVKLLLSTYLPILVIYGVFMWSFHKLPRNPFIYIFVCGFLAGAISIGMKLALLSSYYVLDDIYTWQMVFDKYLVITPLLLFPEAMFNGVIITMFLVYAPSWLYTYQDKFYFDS